MLQDTDAGFWAKVPLGHSLHCAWPGWRHGHSSRAATLRARKPRDQTSTFAFVAGMPVAGRKMSFDRFDALAKSHNGSLAGTKDTDYFPDIMTIWLGMGRVEDMKAFII